MQCGKELAKEAPCDADIVSSVPESGTAAAHGYSRQSGIPFAEVLCKNRYVGRTFIQPSTRLRQLGVAKKFGALSDNVYGKKILLIDDSIVRGNTIGPIIKLLRDAGAKEVTDSHFLNHPAHPTLPLLSFAERIVKFLEINLVQSPLKYYKMGLIIVVGYNKQVHIRIASPPIKYPCYMGINIPTREELIANKLDPSQLAEAVGKI